MAGFTRDQLDVSIEESQLVIRGRQQDDKARQYLHRGIAARQFQRTFVLADGMEVLGADLNNGLLAIDLARPEPERLVKTIAKLFALHAADGTPIMVADTREAALANAWDNQLETVSVH